MSDSHAVAAEPGAEEIFLALAAYAKSHSGLRAGQIIANAICRADKTNPHPCPYYIPNGQFQMHVDKMREQIP